VAGDLNDFDFSETLRIVREGEAQPQPAPGRRQGQSLRGTELFNLWELLPRAERYSYIFEGNSQTLDHILVSPRLLKARPTFDAVHVNSEFFDQVSDHEPLVRACASTETRTMRTTTTAASGVTRTTAVTAMTAIPMPVKAVTLATTGTTSVVTAAEAGVVAGAPRMRSSARAATVARLLLTAPE